MRQKHTSCYSYKRSLKFVLSLCYARIYILIGSELKCLHTRHNTLNSQILLLNHNILKWTHLCRYSFFVIVGVRDENVFKNMASFFDRSISELCFCIFLWMLLIIGIAGSHFRGGTISWKPSGRGNEVCIRFTTSFIIDQILITFVMSSPRGILLQKKCFCDF